MELADKCVLPGGVYFGDLLEGEGGGFDDEIVDGEFVGAVGLGVEDFAESVGVVISG